VENLKDVDNDPEDLAEEFLDFVKSRAGLLVEIGDNQVSFVRFSKLVGERANLFYRLAQRIQFNAGYTCFGLPKSSNPALVRERHVQPPWALGSIRQWERDPAHRGFLWARGRQRRR
jgi:hypothetical protein